MASTRRPEKLPVANAGAKRAYVVFKPDADTQFVPDGASTASKGATPACKCPSPFAFQTAANARPNTPSLELENEPCLVAEIVLIVVPGGEVVNETRQKIIGFDRPNRQVRCDFNIDATPKHHIQGPIAR